MCEKPALGAIARPFLGRSLWVACLIASAACASASQIRSAEQDRLLSVRVNEVLAALPVRNVEGKAYQGVVALLGEVPTGEIRLAAERVAGQIAGVTRVNNLILVTGETSEAAGSAVAQEAPLTAARAEKAPAP